MLTCELTKKMSIKGEGSEVIGVPDPITVSSGHACSDQIQFIVYSYISETLAQPYGPLQGFRSLIGRQKRFSSLKDMTGDAEPLLHVS